MNWGAVIGLGGGAAVSLGSLLFAWWMSKEPRSQRKVIRELEKKLRAAERNATECTAEYNELEDEARRNAADWSAELVAAHKKLEAARSELLAIDKMVRDGSTELALARLRRLGLLQEAKAADPDAPLEPDWN